MAAQVVAAARRDVRFFCVEGFGRLAARRVLVGVGTDGVAAARRSSKDELRRSA